MSQPGASDHQPLADRMAHAVARWAGSVWGLASAVALVATWLAAGPLVGFSDGWMLYINTVTTVVTFLLLFVVQRSVNHEGRAQQLKINELIRAVAQARNERIGIEHEPPDALDQAEAEDLAQRER